MFSYGNNGGDHHFQVHNTNGFQFGLYNVGGGGSHYSSFVIPTVDTWYHIVATRDQSNIKIYINGVLHGATSVVGKNPLIESPVLAIIGARGGINQFVNGTLDDLKIYTRAITPCEVEKLYNENTLTSLKTHNKAEGNIKIYPNPASGNFYINNLEPTALTFEIINSLGQPIKRGEIHASSINEVNIGNGLNRGMYFIKFNNEDHETTTRKLIIE